MIPPKLTLADYERWAKDLRHLKMAMPTEQETEQAHRANTVDAAPTAQGCVLRFGVMSGGTVDLYLNAAQAIHLFRNLCVAGIAGRWMDETGQPQTAPAAPDDLQMFPEPSKAREYLAQKGH